MNQDDMQKEIEYSDKALDELLDSYRNLLTSLIGGLATVERLSTSRFASATIGESYKATHSKQHRVNMLVGEIRRVLNNSETMVSIVEKIRDSIHNMDADAEEYYTQHNIESDIDS